MAGAQTGRERDGRRRRGSGLSLMIVLSVVVTGLVMTMAWASSVQSAAVAARCQCDEAQLAADAAVNWAVVKLRADPTWRPAANQTVTVNGWTCAVSYTDMGPSIGMAAGVLGNPLKFTATATKTGYTGTSTMSADTQGVLAYAPQFWSQGNLIVQESATILGDVETLGSITLNPPASGPPPNKGAPGNWKAKGGVTDNNPGPSGSGKYFVNAPTGNVSTLAAPSMKAIDVYNSLMAGPYVDMMTVLTIDSSGHYVIDFSKAGGKPVHFAGDASYVGSVGVKSSSNPANDTLIMDGDVNFTGSYPYNAAYAQMNLVVHGNVVCNGSGSAGIALHGSSYVTGNWTQTGTYNLQGTVLVDGTMNLGGTGTVNTAVPPSFDPRYVPKVTGFLGNLP
ncbi:MAG TPA: hypothetical protein VH253_00375 [Phycisphaerae bacterium]|nr:hypothetical protein [Phycisphaerae bacterium]